MENNDSTVLVPKQSKISFQKLLMDKDDIKDENHNSDIKTKMKKQEKNSTASEIREPNLVSEKGEIMQYKEHIFQFFHSEIGQ